jgi:hypothetical protein
MDERRKRERRNWRSKPEYPFFDSEGNWVIKNRRRTLDRRLGQAPQRSPSERESRRCLRLVFQGEEKMLSLDHTIPLRLGRKPGCDIEVSASHVSREHARIETSAGEFVLIDQSTNGTYIKLERGSERHVLKGRLVIHGGGVMRLGKPISKRASELIYFWCDTAGA